MEWNVSSRKGLRPIENKKKKADWASVFSNRMWRSCCEKVWFYGLRLIFWTFVQPITTTNNNPMLTSVKVPRTVPPTSQNASGSSRGTVSSPLSRRCRRGRSQNLRSVVLYHNCRKFVSKPVSRVLIRTFCIFVEFRFIMHVVHKGSLLLERFCFGTGSLWRWLTCLLMSQGRNYNETEMVWHQHFFELGEKQIATCKMQK